MTQAVARILADVEQLSADERAELADRLVAEVANHVLRDVEQAQFAELRRRIAQVEAGEVQLIPGEEALARVRGMVESAREKV